MSLRTTLITAAAMAAVATGGILTTPAGSREGTLIHTGLGTWVCKKGRWVPPQ